MVRINSKISGIPVPNIPSGQRVVLESKKGAYARLDYNENMFGACPAATAGFASINPCYYPSFRSQELVSAIAERHSVYPDMVYVSNGSDGILDAVPLLFADSPGDEVIVPGLTYERMRKICQAYGAKVVSVPLINYEIDLKRTLASINDATRVIYIVNPNMPTGTVKTAAEIESFLESVPVNVLVIIDQAYADYIDQKDAVLDEGRMLRRHANLLFLRTFSKYFGLAALRIGYFIAADTRIVDAYLKACQSLPANQYGVIAAAAALKNGEWYAKNVYQPTLDARNFFIEGMYALDIPIVRSQGNFVYVDTTHIGWDNAELRMFLLSQYGVSVRAVHTYGVRITIGTTEQMQSVLDGMRHYLSGHAIHR